MKFQGSNAIQMNAKSIFARFPGGDAEVGQEFNLPYGGRQIRASVVCATGGFYKAGFSHSTAVCRTPQGEYFLAREVTHDRAESGQHLPLFNLPGTGYWLRIKRLTPRGALLVALQHSDPALRADLLALLPKPSGQNMTQRFADGSMAFKLHLAADIARLVRAVGEQEEATPLGIVYWSIFYHLQGVLGLNSRAEEQALRDNFKAHLPAEGVPTSDRLLRLLMPDGTIQAEAKLGHSLFTDLEARAEVCREDWQRTLIDLLERGLRVVNEPGKIVELDDRAQALLERYDEQTRDEHDAAGIQVSDIVNGVVTNWLEAMLKIREGRTDGEAMTEAMRRRQGVFDDLSDLEVESEEEPESGDAAEEDKTRFVFKYAASGSRTARHIEIELSPAQMEMAQEAGKAFGLKPRVFLRRLLEHTLPGQPRWSDDAPERMEHQLRAEHLTFACLDSTLEGRIERAAETNGMSVEEYVADAVRRDVDCDEGKMIVHPQTGVLLCDERDLYTTVVLATGGSAEELEAGIAETRSAHASYWMAGPVSTGQRVTRHEPVPADVILLAAAKPERVQAPSKERVDQPAPGAEVQDGKEGK